MSVQLELLLDAQRDFWSRSGSSLLPDILTGSPESGKHGTVTLDCLITGVCRAPNPCTHALQYYIH